MLMFVFVKCNVENVKVIAMRSYGVNDIGWEDFVCWYGEVFGNLVGGMYL